ncbi:MAG: tail fiber domain-containing protein [Saprospiraceae bacterium]|nr:tail fiber domain-containing protein [Saprospiraceae bacterium]
MNSPYQTNFNSFANRLIIHLIIFVFSMSIVVGQVAFQQKQSVTINENTGPILSLQNHDSDAFAEIGILNNLGKGMSLGVSGSNNFFFNGFPTTPYLFNSSGKDFSFRSANGEEFDFNVDGNDRITVGDFGLKIAAGNLLLLESPNTNELMGLHTKDDGKLYFFRNAVPDNAAICIDDDRNYVGINTALPESDLDVLQANFPDAQTIGGAAADSVGLRLNGWNLYETLSGNFAFVENGILRSYISSGTGAYVNTSDRRLKEDIHPLENILEKVILLNPSRYNYIGASDKTVGFVAQEVQEVFPELVHQNGDYMALSYDNFGVLAIKAIQELSDKVQSLEREVHALKSAPIKSRNDSW